MPASITTGRKIGVNMRMAGVMSMKTPTNSRIRLIINRITTGLSEILRVLKPNGLFVILETSVPTKPIFKQGYQIYSKYILPNIGRLFSKDKKAYSYLSESASVFPYGEELNNILSNIGFINVKDLPQTFGVASIYTASKA